MSGEEKEEEEEEEEDGFRFFLRHEKEGDGADDDEYGVDGRTRMDERGGNSSSPQGQIVRIEVTARLPSF